MSEAIDGAEVMLYSVSLAYKESANVSGAKTAFGEPRFLFHFTTVK
jgi:hypothetical protein